LRLCALHTRHGFFQPLPGAQGKMKKQILVFLLSLDRL